MILNLSMKIYLQERKLFGVGNGSIRNQIVWFLTNLIFWIKITIQIHQVTIEYVIRIRNVPYYTL